MYDSTSETILLLLDILLSATTSYYQEVVYTHGYGRDRVVDSSRAKAVTLHNKRTNTSALILRRKSVSKVIRRLLAAERRSVLALASCRPVLLPQHRS